MWSRKRIDIGSTDLARALLEAFLPTSRRRLARRIEHLWAPAGDGLVTLSVRSGLDLLLAALAFPPGSEVLMTAVTIDDMRRIVAAHGLIPVPVDLDPNDMAPNVAGLERAWSVRARAIVVAHLFGGRIDLEPILLWAHARGLMVIEDCAQAFCGPTDRGHPQSDVAMFSFGSIKTCTALGGALVRMRDSAVLADMRSRQARWPLQSRVGFAAKVFKYAALKCVSQKRVFACFVRVCRQLGYDYDRLLNGWVRGFGADNLLASLRRQPTAPLLALLLRRLRTFDAQRLARRSAKGRWLAALFGIGRQKGVGPQKGLAAAPLGGRARVHTHWVFPIVCGQPEQTRAALVAAGFDANRGGSLTVIPAPADRSELAAGNALQAMRQLLYLPCYVEIPDAELERMARIVQAANDSQAVEGTTRFESATPRH